MKKQLKRWGNNLVIVFTKEEEELYSMKESDRIDLSDMFLIDEAKKGGQNAKGNKNNRK